MLKADMKVQPSVPLFANWVSQALILGGITQVIYYFVSVMYGLTVGSEIYQPEDGLIFYVAGFTFSVPILLYNISLLHMGKVLSVHKSRWIIASSVITAISLLCVPVGLAASAVADVRYGNFAGLGQVTSLLAITLLAVGVLRSHALPRTLAWLLLGVGLSTFPFIILFAIPMGIPIYYTSELPFAAEGLAWVAFALLLRQGD